jgi:hypothetical protein
MKCTGVPYASVILPTLDRDSTLPFALASVQAQTQRSIEILVVLDGATAACRDVVVAAAKLDSRIRVFDLPKAPKSGGYADVGTKPTEQAVYALFRGTLPVGATGYGDATELTPNPSPSRVLAI